MYLWFQLMRNDRVTTSQYCISESGGDDGPLVDAGAKDHVAVAALDLELQLVTPDLRDPRRHHDGASRGGRRQVTHVDLIADRRVAFGQQGLYRAMTSDLHQADHGGGPKKPSSPDPGGPQVASHHS